MTGIFACVCTRAFPTKAAATGLKKLTGAGRVELVKDLCSAEGMATLAAKVREHGIDRIVLAGCPVIGRTGQAASVAEAAGIPAPHVTTVLLSKNADPAGTAPAIRKAVVALEAMPGFETRKLKLAQDVLVIGAGPAGLEAARALATLGHRVTVIDRSASVPAADGLKVLPGTRVVAFDGVAGAYRAKLRGPFGTVERTFGAVVAATGVKFADPVSAPFVPGRVVPMPGLLDRLAGLRLRELPRLLAIVLDLEIDEGKASNAEAFRIALEATRTRRTSVTLFVRDAKVASFDHNAAYDAAREAGVAVLKYTGVPAIRAGDGEIAITARDSVTGADVRLSCDLVALSPYGLPSPADAGLAGVLGLDLDALSHFQSNSSRLLPAATNRRGVYVAGACRGETWLPAVLRDARAAALEAHAFLAPRRMSVDTAHAVVDGDKCALCLTCVRTCPFKAMGIHAADRRADCRPEACRQCGICAGECPNKAITLPAWSDPIVLGLAEPVRRAPAAAGSRWGRA
ncbi:MAG: FAD-dependent oxidoreductase [Spirochaetes bacterium]|nr:FAD-dependent oxidoreductase [Spirochaetota bacterium]